MPAVQLADTVRCASSCALLYKKKMRLPDGTVTDCEPLFPVAMMVPVLGVFDVTCEVPIGFVVLHVRFTLQFAAPLAIVQDVGEAVSVPVVVCVGG